MTVVKRAWWDAFRWQILLVSLAVWHPVSSAAEQAYRLGAGDVIRVTIHRRADLSGTYRVGPDGTFSMPLLGRIEAASMSAAELESHVSRQVDADAEASSHLTSVEIVEFRPVFVVGDVEAPGRYPYVPGMTVIHSIALAGGFRAVRQQDLFVRIELHRVLENYRNMSAELGVTLAREARLIAERAGSTELDFPTEIGDLLGARRQQAVADESTLFQVRRDALRTEIETRRANQTIYQAEISALRAQIAAEDERAALLRQEIESLKSASGVTVVPRQMILSMTREATGIAANRQAALALIARTQAEIGKVDTEILGLENDRRIEIARELAEARERISGLRTSIDAARTVLTESRMWLPAVASEPRARSDALATVLRRTERGFTEVEADELTPLRPGDIVRIPMRGSGIPSPRLESSRISAP